MFSSAITGFFAQEGGHAAELAAESAEAAPATAAEPLFLLFGVPVTNSIFTAWLVIILLVLFAWWTTRKMKSTPSGMQNVWEMIIELWIGVIERTMGPRRGRRFLPVILTVFFFIIS